MIFKKSSMCFCNHKSGSKYKFTQHTNLRKHFNSRKRQHTMKIWWYPIFNHSFPDALALVIECDEFVKPGRIEFMHFGSAMWWFSSVMKWCPDKCTFMAGNMNISECQIQIAWGMVKRLPIELRQSVPGSLSRVRSGIVTPLHIGSVYKESYPKFWLQLQTYIFLNF